MGLEQIFVEENISVIEAMEKLDQTAKKVLFVTEGKKLLATLTDGDIRRWIIAKGALDAPIKLVANYTPVSLQEDRKSEVLAVCEKKEVDSIPIVDSEKNIIDVFWRNEDNSLLVNDKLKDIPVVMMAGGKGTRLYPYTKILPKPLIPVGELPIAEHIIQQFTQFGCKDFYLIVNHKKNMIKAYFNEIEKDYNIFYADEEKPLGTGGGLGLLKGQINSTFILTNCDILIQDDISKIYEYHKEQGNVITMVCSLKNFQIPYGVVEIGDGGSVDKMSEKPKISFFTNTGCYIVESEVIDSIPDGQAIGFPDIVENYKKKGYKVGVYPIGENAWLDMGQMDELDKMRRRLEQE